ncbi:hypothetical protein [Cardiobacterium sp. Marseille-Q4385]|uniref:hypothetical protein n=1 Tax=Cardiobacterium sp. Marseille-Q4385 TaxID=2866573 RepID=UPI001CE480B0|nr:hypothetical protein [Cardiobacterium sp. Marseille-Q4385]
MGKIERMGVCMNYFSKLFLATTASYLVPLIIATVLCKLACKKFKNIYIYFANTSQKDVNLLFSIELILLVEMVIIAYAEQFNIYPIWQFILAILTCASTISIMILFERYIDKENVRNTKNAIIAVAVIQMSIFITTPTVKEINIYIKFLMNCGYSLPIYVAYRIGEGKKKCNSKEII